MIILGPIWLQELQPSHAHSKQQDGRRKERGFPLRTHSGRPTLLTPPWPKLKHIVAVRGGSDSQFAHASLYTRPCMPNSLTLSRVLARGEVYFSTPESRLSPVTCLVLHPRTEGGTQAEAGKELPLQACPLGAGTQLAWEQAQASVPRGESTGRGASGTSGSPAVPAEAPK